MKVRSSLFIVLPYQVHVVNTPFVVPSLYILSVKEVWFEARLKSIGVGRSVSRPSWRRAHLHILGAVELKNVKF